MALKEMGRASAGQGLRVVSNATTKAKVSESFGMCDGCDGGRPYLRQQRQEGAMAKMGGCNGNLATILVTKHMTAEGGSGN
ncbi:hypothetical protein U1Q18_006254 [Sarracenia purpurea var. burkii]